MIHGENPERMWTFLREIVLSVALHGAESWTPTETQVRKLEVWQ